MGRKNNGKTKEIGAQARGEKPLMKQETADFPIERSTDTSPFPVVGIGASAGGLAAFEAFFSGMPADIDPGMAFILVQHLAPDHESILTDLISRYTRMRVFEVEDGMTVLPNCAYIIPPNRDMAFLNGRLQLLEPSAPRGQRLPIDFFFRSLARDQRERAICIVLSGTGSDGTLGVRAVKGEGGMAMAQTPESTEYDGMPRNAIATGLVDYVLPPAEMPAQLIAYVAHAFGKHPMGTPSASKTENALQKLFILLRAQTGQDFSQYKPSTIHRRIERRMAIHQIDSMDEYVRYLQHSPSEIEMLFRDLLIGVTSFFRDSEAFKALEEHVIPKLFAEKSPDATIRVWSPGCSTGEEAYSIAILLAEHQEMTRSGIGVHLFATDIDNHAIATARAGLYPASVAADISPERLSRFFTPELKDGEGRPSAYRIHKNIRDMLIFSEQNVIKDPPFSKLDLVSCRNLLIYMDSNLQKKIIPLFHYSLNPGGFLFLGTSETIGEFDDLFEALDRKHKLYHRKKYAGDSGHIGGRCLPTLFPVTSRHSAGKSGGARKPSLRELTEHALLQQSTPAAALVNVQGDILYLHGRAGAYLELPSGEFDGNILKLAREGLRRELTITLHKVSATKETMRCPKLRIKADDNCTTVNLTVRPLTTGSGEYLYLIVLEEASLFESEQPPFRAPGDFAEDENEADSDARIEALKQDLKTKEEYLQAANEELETSNEELKSSNEEMQSVNEELQSTNEELETSKEELQSVNEELATVNAELQTKVATLSRVNDDMNNLLAGTGIATVFVNHSLHIMRFTPAASRIINLILSDVGRPVGHIVSNLTDYDRLLEDTQAVLDTLIPREIDVQTTEGRWYTMRIQPYRTINNVIEGAVLTFVDITEPRKTQTALRESNDRLRAFLFHSPMLAGEFDLEGRCLLVNPALVSMSKLSPTESIGKTFAEILPMEIAEALREHFDRLLEDRDPIQTEMRIQQGDKERSFITAIFPLFDTSGDILSIGVVFYDISEQKRSETEGAETEENHTKINGGTL